MQINYTSTPGSDRASSEVPTTGSDQAEVSSLGNEQSDVLNGGLNDLRLSSVLPDSWSDHSPSPLVNVLLCRISSQSGSSAVPLKITHCLKVESDLSWSLFVNQHQVDPSKCSALKSFPQILNSKTLSLMLIKVDRLSICAGQPDEHFVRMVAAKKGKVLSQDGKVAAYVDSDTCPRTVRTVDCELLSPTTKCQSCKAYRANLRSMYSRWSKHRAFDESDTSSHTNDRYLMTPEKKRRLE